jgi:hypothetical protein
VNRFSCNLRMDGHGTLGVLPEMHFNEYSLNYVCNCKSC